MPRTPRRTFVLAVILAATAGVAAYYYLVDPATAPMPRCLLRAITGWNCPGCGSQRALHALLHGHLAQAWHLNAAMLIGAPLALLAIAAETWPRCLKRLHAVVVHPWTPWTVGTLIAGWWILRNLV